ncbi:DUF3265 domain-containing protein [Vibrio parahaemolyticus]|nr:DUF3265 domain-containing protein [Vibrio parahaemolyticus]EIA9327753.1 DUF3265 domain-containing protein [Vibrio parahaemolyticus]EJG1815112.1 DUF3265 domain-containing protein [Vibrio parahaemolyticus]ELA9574314.1 DUF3265 domain-containing protein [Vibrio parahaemolyticus]
MCLVSLSFILSKVKKYVYKSTYITKRLRGIHAAWHFWFAVSFGGESGLRKVGLGGTHPLTRRYMLRSLAAWKNSKK